MGIGAARGWVTSSLRGNRWGCRGLSNRRCSAVFRIIRMRGTHSFRIGRPSKPCGANERDFGLSVTAQEAPSLFTINAITGKMSHKDRLRITEYPREAPGLSRGQESGLPPLGGNGFLCIVPSSVALQNATMFVRDALSNPLSIGGKVKRAGRSHQDTPRMGSGVLAPNPYPLAAIYYHRMRRLCLKGLG